MKMISPELRRKGLIYTIRPKFWPRPFIKRTNRRTRRRYAGKPGTESLIYEQICIPREDGSTMRVCVYKPKNEYCNAIGLLWLHGGGFAYGIPEDGAGFIELLSSEADCVTFAPDYRLSCDAPYPAAIDDCYSALEFMVRHAGQYGIDTDRIFVAGESAGGGLTASLCLLARDRGDISIACQLPLYPMTDDRSSGSKMHNNAPVWNESANRKAWRMYLGKLRHSDNIPPYAVPCRAADFNGLPPAISYIGSLDPLLDETRAYISALREAGIDTDYREFEGGYHAFEMLCAGTKISDEALCFLRERFKSAAERYRCPQPKDQE